jgi:N-methylhydantoinase A/oxoprolinase/acetone carboxylase beta subunit
VPPESDLRLGIDVGSTHTDAVLIDHDDRLLAKCKEPTTDDVVGGISAAIGGVLDQPGRAGRVRHAMLGTTQAANAIVKADGLRSVAALRIGGPATHSVPPLATWPDSLRLAVLGGSTIVNGGIELDGSELHPLDEDEIRSFLDGMAGRVDAVAVTCVFSSVSDRHERRAEELVREMLGEIPVALSHEIGSVGLIERENATVLNAALMGTAEDMAAALVAALTTHELDARPYFAQNDGTLMALDHARRYPVLTIGCGPANSLRGAALLSGLHDAIVADVGGASTEIGALVGGLPAENNEVMGIAGIRTNFRMPALIALPYGGGTVVDADSSHPGLSRTNVGQRLPQEALVFGGRTPTLTDAAVTAGRVDLGDTLPPNTAEPALAAALAELEDLVTRSLDRVKVGPDAQPLVVVGGAGFLVGDDVTGAAPVVRPQHAEVANAIGAAVAQASGHVERVVHFRDRTRADVVGEASNAAYYQAVLAGADPERIEIVDIEEVPLAYLGDRAARIRVRALGPLESFKR